MHDTMSIVVPEGHAAHGLGVRNRASAASRQQKVRHVVPTTKPKAKSWMGENDPQKWYSFCSQCAEKLARLNDNSGRIFSGLNKARREVGRGIHPWPHVMNKHVVVEAEPGVYRCGYQTTTGVQLFMFPPMPQEVPDWVWNREERTKWLHAAK